MILWCKSRCLWLLGAGLKWQSDVGSNLLINKQIQKCYNDRLNVVKTSCFCTLIIWIKLEYFRYLISAASPSLSQSQRFNPRRLYCNNLPQEMPFFKNLKIFQYKFYLAPVCLIIEFETLTQARGNAARKALDRQRIGDLSLPCIS